MSTHTDTDTGTGTGTYTGTGTDAGTGTGTDTGAGADADADTDTDTDTDTLKVYWRHCPPAQRAKHSDKHPAPPGRIGGEKPPRQEDKYAL